MTRRLPLIAAGAALTLAVVAAACLAGLARILRLIDEET